MRRDQKVGFAIYVLVVLCAIVVMGVLIVLLGDGPGYATPEQIRTYLATQPPECRPIARARLVRRLMQETAPLRPTEIRSVLRETDAADCGIASRQLETLLSQPGTLAY